MAFSTLTSVDRVSTASWVVSLSCLVVGLQDAKKALISNSTSLDLGDRKFIVNVSIIKEKSFLTKYLLAKIPQMVKFAGFCFTF